MPVKVRQAGGHWSVEVQGASIGVADTQLEAFKLANYWQARLSAVARWRGHTHPDVWPAVVRDIVVHRFQSPERLAAERARVIGDIANITEGIQHTQALAAARQITSDYADSVIAQCREEHRTLSDRLKVLDTAIAESDGR